MTAMPRRVNFGPFVWRVTDRLADWQSIAPDKLNDHWGYTDHTSATILINPESNDALKRVTLLHELLHAAAFSAGQLDNRKRVEEDWVVMVAPQLLDTLARSPGLVAYLTCK